LHVGLVWFGVGISLVIAYTIWVYASFRGKVERSPVEEHY
jgi:cytochrome bd-type quinol oxidase subunit 2